MSVLAVLGVVGCGDDDAPGADAPVAAPDAPAAAATVTLAAANTTVAAGADIEVTVAVTDFILEAAGGANADGHGHYHIFLDADTGPDYLVNDFASPRAVPIPPATAAGAHTLRIELMNNDHTGTGIEDTLDITVN